MTKTDPRPPPADSILRVEISPSPETIAIRLIGEMDLSTKGQLLTEMASAPLNGAPLVTFDLRRLDFCDASGLADLLAARAAMNAEQRTCSASHARPFVQRLLSIAGLADLFTPEAA